MKILVTGANGLLGQKLVELYQKDSSVELVATGLGRNRNKEGNYSYATMDITSQSETSSIIGMAMPDVVINTAAMTNVDQCELNQEACRELNVIAVQNLIKACEDNGSKLIHLSTDFIFDGENGPYEEDDWPNPLSYYAESKLEAEKLIEKTYLKWAIVRTMLVYGIVRDMSRTNILLCPKYNIGSTHISHNTIN